MFFFVFKFSLCKLLMFDDFNTKTLMDLFENAMN